MYGAGQDGLRMGSWLLILRLHDFGRDKLALCERELCKTVRMLSLPLLNWGFVEFTPLANLLTLGRLDNLR